MAVAEEAQVVLDRISRVFGEVERLLTDNNNASEAKQRLIQARRNLEAIRATIDEDRFNTLSDVLDELRSITDAQVMSEGGLPSQQLDGRQLNGQINRPPSNAGQGQKGRPKLEVPLEQLQYLYKKGYPAKRMAQHFKCSVSAVYKLLYQHGMKMRQRYTSMCDEELMAIVSNLSKQHPNSGTEMISGYLRSQGISVPRQKLRSVLRAADQVGIATRWGKTVARRT
ncbi:hypothetical protein HOLleu_42925 [Holothuria leucospilota]|uniref:Uncharacterized protein n=1 Tax=Holothuria leucospilota TaxID=206669 RepID=A0A9Q0YCG9_HOLLE|nr:hypothetical protein HOLleu_42925 [Holothuria leucospilota]